MASSEQNNKPLVTLMSSDGEYFTEERSVVVQFCGTIKNMEDSGCLTKSAGILIPKVDAETLALVLEYCKEHAEKDSSEDPAVKEELNRFDTEFVNNSDPLLLFRLLVAAYFLGVDKLLAAVCKEFSGRVDDRSPQEIRNLLRTLNDYALRNQTP